MKFTKRAFSKCCNDHECKILFIISPLNEPRSEKTGLRSFRPGLTQTGLYSH